MNVSNHTEKSLKAHNHTVVTEPGACLSWLDHLTLPLEHMSQSQGTCRAAQVSPGELESDLSTAAYLTLDTGRRSAASEDWCQRQTALPCFLPCLCSPCRCGWPRTPQDLLPVEKKGWSKQVGFLDLYHSLVGRGTAVEHPEEDGGSPFELAVQMKEGCCSQNFGASWAWLFAAV